MHTECYSESCGEAERPNQRQGEGITRLAKSFFLHFPKRRSRPLSSASQGERDCKAARQSLALIACSAVFLFLCLSVFRLDFWKLCSLDYFAVFGFVWFISYFYSGVFTLSACLFICFCLFPFLLFVLCSPPFFFISPFFFTSLPFFFISPPFFFTSPPFFIFIFFISLLYLSFLLYLLSSSSSLFLSLFSSFPSLHIVLLF